MEEKNRKGLKLIVKLMLAVMVPLLVTSIFAIMAVKSAGNDTALQMAQSELRTAANAVGLELAFLSIGDDTVAAEQEVIANFKSKTGLDVILMEPDSRIISTLDASILKNWRPDSGLQQRVLSGEEVFDRNMKISGTSYVGYYLAGEKGEEGKGIIIVARTMKSMTGIYMRHVNKNVIFMAVLFVISAIAAASVIQLIVRALLTVIARLDKVAEGYLVADTNSALYERRDEIGKVARSIRTLVESFKGIIKDIILASNHLTEVSGVFAERFDSITDSISDVNNAVSEIANGATSQAGETQNVNEKVIHMGNAIEATSANAAVLSASSDKMKEYNATVRATLEELEQISMETRDSVEQVRKQTDMTNHSAMEIRTATEMITDIASQTNLLSLNASIEAARAGEHGRGFAVVADEIRVLADQSKESAEKIAGIIGELIRNSNTSVDIMHQMTEIIGKQNDRLHTTKEVFHSLDEEIDSVAGAIHQIGGEVDQLTKIKKDVLESVESLASIAEENAAGTEETSASMQELNEIILECRTKTEEMTALAETLLQNTKKVTIEE